jgi:hypothetical protein
MRASALALGVISALPILISTRRAEAVFRYFTRKDLAHGLATEPDKWVDQDVTVTDELAYVFPDNPEADTDQAGGTKCVRFDTVHFRCAVDTGKKGDYLDACWEEAKKGCKDILVAIDEVNEAVRKRTKSESDADKERRELYSKLHARWRAKPIVTVFGKVARVDFYTPGYYLQGKNRPDDEAKARPEPLTILCERVEKPRERYFEFGLDDNND